MLKYKHVRWLPPPTSINELILMIILIIIVLVLIIALHNIYVVVAITDM